jgi:hypothetical protein
MATKKLVFFSKFFALYGTTFEWIKERNYANASTINPQLLHPKKAT